MPLSEPAPREQLHTRAITLRGFKRADGLFDIEASIEDTKTYAISTIDRGEIAPGVPLHRMLARMTVTGDLLITAFEADTEFGPYGVCPAAAPAFAGLAGLSIRPGFLRAANAQVGGTHGCTHLRELLQQMATVAYQTTIGQVRSARAAEGERKRPRVIDTCLAWAADGPVVKRNWPEFYTGEAGSPDEGVTPPPAPSA